MATLRCVYAWWNEDRLLLEKLHKLHSLCFPNLSDKPNFKVSPTKIVKFLKSILKHFSTHQLQDFGPYEIISCSVRGLYLCNEHNYTTKFYKCRNIYKTALHCYLYLLEVFITERTQEVINIVIEEIDYQGYWRWEDLCYDSIHGLFKFSGHLVVHSLLDKAMDESISFKNSVLIIRNLHEVLKNYFWPDTQETVIIVERLLELYRNEISISDDVNASPTLLVRGLEVCIRNISINLSNKYLLVVIYRMCSWAVEENSSKIVQFASILEYACYLREPDLLKNALTDKLFALIMEMISSPNQLVSLLGNRVLQHLIDRSQNRSLFESPQIFFEDTKYNITLNQCNKSDKEFLKQHREVIHDTFVKCIMQHCSKRLNLECTYCTLCLIAVEVPCGFTSAALVCLVMNVQDLTLRMAEMKRQIAYHTHTTVMAVLTLICSIHNAKVLYTYVNKVMMERAQWAPHLNPPLKSKYSYAVHYVLWNKSELFFVDWEVRFGLWKCFRLHTDKVNFPKMV